MKRLTHEVDFGFEDWEETLFLVGSDPHGAYNILDIARYQGEPEFDEILKNIALRLAAIEDILGDEYDMDGFRELVKAYREERYIVLKEPRQAGVHRLSELAQADRDGRCVVLPCKIGDIVYEIRYTAENDRPRKHARKRFDHSVSGCTWRMREQPEMCYVSEKKCTKSDFEFMGRTVFLTRAEAEDALRREQDG